MIVLVFTSCTVFWTEFQGEHKKDSPLERSFDLFERR